MGMKYEYQRVTSTEGNMSLSVFTELLNVMGHGGWECMDSPEYVPTLHGGHYAVWMERAIDEVPMVELLDPRQAFNQLRAFFEGRDSASEL